MSTVEFIKRYFVFALSIFFISLGVSATVSSRLGTSPISSAPFVFSVNTPLSIGTYLFILSIILIAIQMILLGREGIKQMRWELILQLPISVLFGLCTDFAMWLLQDLTPALYITRVLTLIGGCAILSLGIALEVTAGVAMMGGEYTVQLISKRFKLDFGMVKMFFDITLLCIAVTSSLLFTATVVGVREGTIISAIIIGPLVKFIMPHLRIVSKWLGGGSPTPTKDRVVTSGAILITISREYGSGGHAIGEMLAERLNIPFYDKNLVEMVAHEGDFDASFVSKNEQNLNTSLYKMMIQDYEAPLEKSMSPEDLLFVAQSKVINRIAEQGSCVIVGRCSNYILDHYPNNISIFIHSDIEKKRARAVEQYGLTPDQATAEIKRIDKARADHFYHYTGKRWGDARSYQLCCDSSVLSPEEICDTVERLYKRALTNLS